MKIGKVAQRVMMGLWGLAMLGLLVVVGVPWATAGLLGMDVRVLGDVPAWVVVPLVLVAGLGLAAPEGRSKRGVGD